jgi:hypothetical protein
MLTSVDVVVDMKLLDGVAKVVAGWRNEAGASCFGRGI